MKPLLILFTCTGAARFFCLVYERTWFVNKYSVVLFYFACW